VVAKLRYSKSALQHERNQLKLYQRTLPSLELKRRQLSIELARARVALEQARRVVEELEVHIGDQLPMLANPDMELSGLVELEDVEIGEENVVGVHLPVLRELHCRVADYSLLSKPAWFDVLVDRLRDAARHEVEVLVAAERVRILQYQERRVTQRVNLFEKILIPTAERNIQRIRIYLGDAERAAVVRSKIVKAKQARARAGHLLESREI